MAKKKPAKKKVSKKKATAKKANPVPKTEEETSTFLQAKRSFAAQQAEDFNKRFRK